MVWNGNRRKALFSAATAVVAFAFARTSEAAQNGDFTIMGGMSNAEDVPPAKGKRRKNSASVIGDMQGEEGPGGGQIVAFERKLAPGTIVVKTGERALYFIMSDGKAMRYRVGVGKEGFSWSGRNRVSRKAEWPAWHPPAEMIAREAKKGRKLPAVMEGGPQNPLGARAIYIGATLYRIHGTTQRWSIGRAVSSGCIRMLNEDVIDLYDRVGVGAAVIVES
jgi:lipoprotein-anchoring transpeptidase ErfK/SrfK